MGVSIAGGANVSDELAKGDLSIKAWRQKQRARTIMPIEYLWEEESEMKENRQCVKDVSSTRPLFPDRRTGQKTTSEQVVRKEGGVVGEWSRTPCRTTTGTSESVTDFWRFLTPPSASNLYVRYAFPCLRGLHPSASEAVENRGLEKTLSRIESKSRSSEAFEAWTLRFEATRGLASASNGI